MCCENKTETLKMKLSGLLEKGFFHIFAGSFFSKVVSYFGSIVVVRILTKYEYGTLSYIENIGGYFYVFAGMGLSYALIRYVILGKTRQEKFNYFFYCVKNGFLFNMIVLIASYVFNTIYNHPADYASYTWLIYINILGIPFQYITDNCLANERASFGNKNYAVMSFLLVFSIISGKIISGIAFGLSGVVIAQVLTYFVIAFIYYNIEKKRFYKNLAAEKINRNKIKEINIYSIQYMITNGLWSIFMLNDTFLLGRFCTPDVLADYKVAYTLPGLIALAASAIGTFTGPFFVKYEDDKNWIKSNFKKLLAINVIIMGSICSILVIFAEFAVYILYGASYVNIVPIMRILLLASFFNNGLRYIVANTLASMGKVKYNMQCSMGGIIIAFLINLFMIPKFGAIGAAVTSCVVYLLMGIYLTAQFIRLYYK